LCIKQSFEGKKMTTPNLTPEAYPEKHVQERLLNAAEQLFCEHGFEGTSVRDIAAAAVCNIASVNYYFGGKDKLYFEVFRRHMLPLRDAHIESINRVMSQTNGFPSLEDLLRAFANTFVGAMTDEKKGRRFAKLMNREMSDPHLPKDMFIDEFVLPFFEALQQALVKICPGLGESQAVLVIHSILGQLEHAIHAKTMFEGINNPMIPAFELVEIVDHIVKFSAAGIHGCVQTKNSQEGG